nr:hypothetical protein [Rhodococcus wratislaviensis]
MTAARGVWALTAGAVLLFTQHSHTLLDRNQLQHWEHEWKLFDLPPR